MSILSEARSDTEYSKDRAVEFTALCRKCNRKMAEGETMAGERFRLRLKCPRCTRVTTLMGEHCTERAEMFFSSRVIIKI